MVLDADALTCLARQLPLLRGAQARPILTPHPGEMARLLGADTGAVQADRVAKKEGQKSDAAIIGFRGDDQRAAT